MNILFLNPPILKNDTIFMKEIGRCGSTATGNQYWPQTGLAYLAAVAEKKHKVKIIDAMAESIPTTKIIDITKNFAPDLVVIHTTTPTFKNDSQFLAEIKKDLPNVKSGFVGTHVSNTVKESLDTSLADFILVNEPELTFEDLLNNFLGNWNNIPGLAFRLNSTIKINKLRPLVENLDILPFPARHLLPNQKYRMVLTNNEVFATVVSSRGCPHSCIYCRVGYPWGKRFRKRSVNNVVEEIKEIKTKFGIKNIVFMADTFTIDKNWVINFCDKLIKENLKMNWLCNSRIDTIDEEMLKKMKEAGCSLISFGIESGSQDILNKAKKKLDIRKAENAIKITKNAGVKTFAYFVVGLPGETKQTIKKTIKFAKKLDPDYVNFHIATPHPGTELYDIAKKNNWIVDTNYEHYDQSGNYSVMRNKDLTAEQILLAQKSAMRNFYFRPKYIIKQLSKLKKPKDIIELGKIGVQIFMGI